MPESNSRLNVPSGLFLEKAIVPYLLTKRLDGPFLNVSVPNDPRYAEFAGRRAPNRIAPVRASGVTPNEFFPEYFDARLGPGSRYLGHPINKDVTFDLLSSGDGSDFLIVSQKVRDILVSLVGEDALFIATELRFGEIGEKESVPGNWFVVDFHQQMNPILEDRSNVLDVLYSKSVPVADAEFYCNEADVLGLGLWCGLASSSGSDFPDRFCGPKQVYFSDKVYDALAAAGALQGWDAIPIEALPNDEVANYAPGSPKDLRQTYRLVAQGWIVTIADFHSKSYSGDFDEVREHDGRDAYRFHFDDDLPAYRFFEFGGCVFANETVQLALGGTHLFTKALLYEDQDLKRLRTDTGGFGVLTAPRANLDALPGLSWSRRDEPPRIVMDLAGFGKVRAYEIKAYRAFLFERHPVWETGGGRVFMLDSVLKSLLAAGLIGDNNVYLQPVEFWERG